MVVEVSPIILFVFMRPEHTRNPLGVLAYNLLASQNDLVVYSDTASDWGGYGGLKLIHGLCFGAQHSF